MSLINDKKDICAISEDKSIAICIKNIYVKDTLMYFPVYIENLSNVDYEIAVLKMKIHVKDATKVSAHQENYIEPVHIFNEDIKTIKAKESVKKIFVCNRFTISPKKELVVEASEENGERRVNVKVQNRSLIKAKRL